MYRSLLLIIFIVLSGHALVQTNTNSPYSSKGIGNVGFYGSAYTTSLGGAATTLADSTQANLFNPATYSLVAKELPLFSFGINHFQKQFSYQGETSQGRFTGLTHFSLIIPFAKRFGVAAGLKPFSRTGYEINNYELVQGDSIFYDYKGKGDIQEFILGFSATLLNYNKHKLSIGVNGKYYFGEISNERKAYKVVKAIQVGGVDISSTHAKDLGIEVGINYNYRPNSEHSIHFGGVYRPDLNLNFEKNKTQIYFGNYYIKQTYDTLFSSGVLSGKIFLPAKTNIGLTYTYTPQNKADENRTRLPSLMVAFDYSIENWGNYKETFENTTTSGQYIDANSIRLGFEYIPHRLVNDRLAKFSFLSKMSYRLGAFMVNTPYETSGVQLIDKGLNAGIGIPFLISRAVSTINIAASYGVLDRAGNPNVLKENYYGVSFGINIAPGYDRWFKKYKLD